MSKVKDPVCGMRFEAGDAAGSTIYESEPVYFCSDQCRRDFESDPARYYDRLERRRNRFSVTNGY
ncbi:MAG: YHS domain-containing protein [Gemmatimonadales bacterium]